MREVENTYRTCESDYSIGKSGKRKTHPRSPQPKLTPRTVCFLIPQKKKFESLQKKSSDELS